MLRTSITIYFLSVLFCSHGQRSIDVSTNLQKEDRVMLTFGYLYSQDTILNAIIVKDSTLKNEAIKIRSRFDLKFGKAKEIVMSQFSEEERNEIRQTVDDTIGFWINDKDNRVAFLKLVEARSVGRIESPVLETILHFEYRDNVEQELFDGWYYTDTTYYDPTLRIILTLPLSWDRGIQSENLFDNGFSSIQRSDLGLGEQFASIGFHKLSGLRRVKKSQFYRAKFKNESLMRPSFEKKGFQLIDLFPVLVDGEPACLYVLDNASYFGSHKTFLRHYVYQVHYCNVLLTITFSCRGQSVNDLNFSDKNFRLLFENMGALIQIEDEILDSKKAKGLKKKS